MDDFTNLDVCPGIHLKTDTTVNMYKSYLNYNKIM